MMQQLLEFVGNHPFLVMALVVISALLVYTLVSGSKGALDTSSVTELINHKQAVVIDVRPTADFSQGHIINAINIPMNGFKNQIGSLEKHKDKPIVISCRSGAQSSQACNQLRKEGFSEVYNLKGGMLAWQDANLPTTRK